MRANEGPVLINATHSADEFDCGNEPLNGWLRRSALQNQGDGSSRTWVVTVGVQVVAYYASSVAALVREEAPGRFRRNRTDPLPAMLLGRLAVDLDHQGRGLAAAMLNHFLNKALEVSELTGLRLVQVNALDDRAADFCRLFEFEDSPSDDLTLTMLLSDAQRPRNFS